MSLEIYPSDLSTRYELTHAISVQMSVYYNDIGKVSITAAINDYNINALKVGSMLYDTTRGVTYIFVEIKYDTDNRKIFANGYTANWLLNKRIIATSYHMTTIESGVYAIINANLRGMTGISTATETGLTEATDTIFYGGQILDEIMPYLEEGELGQKMIWNPSTLTHTFKVYKGTDRTSGIHRIVFSEEFGTAEELTINDDDSTLKNVAYVLGELGDDSEGNPVTFVEIVGTTTGNARREIWLDSSITLQDDETEAECRARAVAYGQVELAQRIRRQTFTITVDPEELGSQYDLGDVVSCVSVRFGVSFNARITGIKYKMDSNSTTTEIVLGDPILTALGELKLNG